MRFINIILKNVYVFLKPARLVIIKSTQIYQGASGYVEYPASSILQMVGRAGRSSIDRFGLNLENTQRLDSHIDHAFSPEVVALQ